MPHYDQRVRSAQLLLATEDIADMTPLHCPPWVFLLGLEEALNTWLLQGNVPI